MHICSNGHNLKLCKSSPKAHLCPAITLVRSQDAHGNGGLSILKSRFNIRDDSF